MSRAEIVDLAGSSAKEGSLGLLREMAPGVTKGCLLEAFCGSLIKTPAAAPPGTAAFALQLTQREGPQRVKAEDWCGFVALQGLKCGAHCVAIFFK